MQRNLQDLVNPFNRFNLQILLDIVRNFLQIAYVLFRNDHRLDPATVCRQQFFLQATDRQHLTTQGDFTGHGNIGAHRNPGQGRYQRRAHAYTRARAILGRRPFRHMDVGVALLMEVQRDPQALRTAAYHRQGCSDRFDHDIAQRTGLDQLPLARHHGRFDGQQFAAHLGPGQARDLAHLILLLGQAVTEFAHAEEVLEHVGGHFHREAFFQRMLFDRLAAHLGNLALKATYTGFASVVANDVADRFSVEFQLAFFQAVGLNLFR
ncbi:hypothetical protein D3C85_1185710 [compost metagenome]